MRAPGGTGRIRDALTSRVRKTKSTDVCMNIRTNCRLRNAYVQCN